ncbi:MAG: homocysteine methyltransferase [Ruminococcaceae bacterium]|nr:homocysteine methyltransferase [Oscillospiraceae bacterium]
MKITEFIKENTIFLDGGMGTLLQKEGLLPGELPERWNVSHPDVIRAVHLAYFKAGSHVVATNTFGANVLKYSPDELDAVIEAAVANARWAQREAKTAHPTWVALDIGPTGRMLAPYGDLGFEDAVAIFAETVRLGVKHGVDLILIETMADTYETKAALLAAKENSTLPVFVSCAFGADGKLLTGADAPAVVAMLEGLGADAVGANCSEGPAALSHVIESFLANASVPVLFKPNAGLPKSENGRTIYNVAPEEFADAVFSLVEKGVRAVGGCCGTTPEYIEALVRKAKGITPLPLTEKNETVVSSYTHAVTFGDAPVLIGERINPTGKPRFKEALRAHDMDYILREGLAEEEKGVHILDVNVGLPEIDEREMLSSAVLALQAVTALPLQIDTADADAMEAALRLYNGKPMINSVNGKKESMDAVLPLAKKYGGVVVALTLDEAGIPEKAEARVAIARRILEEGRKYGLREKDFVFDPLALTVSADSHAAKETLRAVEMIRRELGCHVSLGVSNVSFGLPSRDLINGTFFAMALTRGLSAAIMNPHSSEMMKTYYTYRTLEGLDENCADYIAFAEAASNVAPQAQASADVMDLRCAIVRGLKDVAAALTQSRLASGEAPLSLVENEIIPALNTVGEGFENKTVYLPGLLIAAEAAKRAFDEIKKAMPEGKPTRSTVVLATVKGDIHDIGKNIVKLLLENYGFAVLDLGRDVLPDAVVDAVKRTHAPLVGLSALMTTTVPAMEDTIRLLRAECPHVRVMVGGAVLTREYADAIGADFYAPDAMAGVRYAESLN